ncbi:MAG: hypothetical protein D6758_12795 [Gammaproteobacteria bacterium]|nr:MAG: hypothetical protein D6758_12795 [Gammaproteobacteria bacterium]
MSLTLIGSATLGHAEESALNTSNWWSYNQKPVTYTGTLYASSAGTNTSVQKASALKEEYPEPLFTLNAAHKYLGLATLAALAGTIIAPKKENGAHETLGKTSAVLGTAAVATGLIAHWDDIGLDQPLTDPDNLHAMLTSVGLLGMAYAASEGPESGHAGPGALGGIAMAVGVKLTW